MGHRWRSHVVVACALVVSVVGTAPGAGAASRSPGVAEAQKRLNALHCDAGPADGRLGRWTRSSVIRFQSRHGLRQTGRLDPGTRQRLSAPTAARCDVRPVPSRTGTGRRIVISQVQNWVWLVGADGRSVAQGGIVDNTSVLRRGTYRTGSYCGRAARVSRNSSGSLWLDDFVRFAPCGIGFHRIPRLMSGGRQMHADYLLGTDLARSHGCIRLSAAMAQRIWDFTAGGGTVVQVR